MHIRYHDRYLPGPGGWRIQERQVLVDRTETRPVTSGMNLAEEMIWVLCSSPAVPV
jgi:hypothetical protein